jgi:hypothetical protein
MISPEEMDAFFWDDSPRSCDTCGRTFTPDFEWRRVCSPGCNPVTPKKPYVAKHPPLVEAGWVNSSIVGAVGECRVCADLLSRGYYVYRSMSASSPADLVVHREGGPLVRIDVKMVRNGRVTSDHLALIKQGRCDVIAVVGPEGIVYEPPLPS